MSTKEVIIEPAAVDRVIADLDRRFAAQLEAILGHRAVRRLEAVWRELAFLVDAIDFRENVRLTILQARWGDLERDVHDRDPMPRWLASIPFSRLPDVIVGQYVFGTDDADVDVLERIASTVARIPAVFLAEAARAVLKAPPTGARWSALRDREESSFLGLSLSRFLLRGPHEHGGREELVELAPGPSNRPLFGGGAVALASRIAAAFARYRLCANMIGPVDGAVAGVVPTVVEGRGAIALDLRLSQRRQWELCEQGFITLDSRSEDGAPFFGAANAVRRPRSRGPTGEETPGAIPSQRVPESLPHTFAILRFAPYLRAVRREHIGAWRSVEAVERGLSEWLARYVLDPHEAPRFPGRARPFFRSGTIQIHGEGDARSYVLTLEPRFLYLGGPLLLTLRGELAPSAATQCLP